MKSETICLLILLTTVACSSGNGHSQSPENKPTGTFKLELSSGKGFSHQSKKFKVINATSDYFEFKSLSWQTRFSASQLDESAPSSSSKLIYNNTFVSFFTEVKGKRTKVMCKPEQKPLGVINITSIENNSYSGEFEFELVKCNAFYSSAPFSGIELPLQAKGTFTQIPYESHLGKLMKK